MGEQTNISWTDATFNTAWGCTKVSEECTNCYMFRMSGMTKFKADVPTPLNQTALEPRLKGLINKGAKVIFVNSMSDTFHKDFSFDLIKSWFQLFRKYPEIQFQILTKRIERAKEFLDSYPCPDNCWIGTSIGTKRALPRLEILKSIKTKIKFLSLEPLLEDLGTLYLGGIDWVIVGGESDYTKPREFKEEWGINILNQCRKQGIPFFYKQKGGNRNVNGIWGSDLLDGIKYHELPVLLGTKQSTLKMELS